MKTDSLMSALCLGLGLTPGLALGVAATGGTNPRLQQDKKVEAERSWAVEASSFPFLSLHLVLPRIPQKSNKDRQRGAGFAGSDAC